MQKLLLFLCCTLLSTAFYAQTCGRVTFGDPEFNGNLLTIPVQLDTINESNITSVVLAINHDNASNVNAMGWETDMENTINSAYNAASNTSIGVSESGNNGTITFTAISFSNPYNLNGSFDIFDIIVEVTPGETITFSFNDPASRIDFTGGSCDHEYGPDLTVTVPGYTIAGNITGAGPINEVVQVDVNIENLTNANTELSAITNGDGNYTSIPLGGAQDYELTPTKTGNTGCGVSNFDITLIQRHIDGSDYFDDIWQNIAADVTDEGNISTFDITKIRRQILGLEDLANSWYFTPVDYYNFNLPLSSTSHIVPYYDRTDTIENILSSQIGVDFFGFKAGDVNGSCPEGDMNFTDPTLLAEQRNSIRRQLRVGLPKVDRTGYLVMPVYADDFSNQINFSVELKLDDFLFREVEILAGELPDFDSECYHIEQKSDGVYLNVLWFTMQRGGASLAANQPLFYIKTKPNFAITNLERLITLSHNRLDNRVYNIQGASDAFELVFFDVKESDEPLKTSIIKQPKVFPTLVNDQVTFDFELDKAARVDLVISNQNGRVISHNYFQLEKGQNSVQINDLEGVQNGTYHYQIIANGQQVGGTLIKAEK